MRVAPPATWAIQIKLAIQLALHAQKANIYPVSLSVAFITRIRTPLHYPPPPRSITNLTAGNVPATAASACTACPAGYVCRGDQYDPYPVGFGLYATAGNSEYSDWCPTGTYTLTEVNPSSASCLNCESSPGKMCRPNRLSNSSNPDEACMRGFYCPGGGGASSVVACPAGTYNALYSQTSSAACLPCTATPGSECSAGSEAITGSRCYTSTYCTGGSATAQGCSGIPAGQFCTLGSAANVGVPCYKGLYCTGGNGNYGNCQKGQYQDETGQSTCKTCPVSSGGLGWTVRA